VVNRRCGGRIDDEDDDDDENEWRGNPKIRGQTPGRARR